MCFQAACQILLDQSSTLKCLLPYAVLWLQSRGLAAPSKARTISVPRATTRLTTPAAPRQPALHRAYPTAAEINTHVDAQ